MAEPSIHPSLPADLVARVRAFRDDDFDPTTQAELDALLAQPAERALAELTDRFAGELEFGTAGLRGLLGAGPNRMNRAVVVRTTAGLARWVLDNVEGATTRGVVVGRDARRGSVEFAQETASVLAAAGIPVHYFEEICGTPLVAYAVKDLGAAAGVMVTASHNPPEYNGYKVYAQNGAQIIPPIDAGIAGAIAQAGPARAIARMPLDEARTKGLLRPVPAALFDRYCAAVATLSKRGEGRGALKVVYTPMHGVGERFVKELFAKLGFPEPISVAEQARPDGAFPTVRFPNPEEPGALDLALALAKREQADVLIANDPDADRLAIATPRDAADRGGEWVVLSGNDVGVLLAHYLLVDDPSPAPDRLVVTTIVSSTLLSEIAKGLGVRYAETLTGFKWITNRGIEIERETGTRFVMGYEEALGYTAGTVVRDKDGISAAALFAEMVATLKTRGETLLGRLEAIHRQFGLVLARQHNVTPKGKDGAAEIAAEMEAMRASPPSRIGAHAVLAVADYKHGTRKELASGQTSSLGLPSSNVLAFLLEGGSRVTMRPSGTEPKIKYYFDLREPIAAREAYADARSRATGALDALVQGFLDVVASRTSLTSRA
jgi:phosphomannomutase